MTMTIHAKQLSPAQPSEELAAAIRLLCAVYRRAHRDACCRQPRIAAEAREFLADVQGRTKEELFGHREGGHGQCS